MDDPPQELMPAVYEIPPPAPRDSGDSSSITKIRNRYLKRNRRPLPDGLAILLVLIAAVIWLYRMPDYAPQTSEEINAVFPYIERLADRDLLTAELMEESPSWQWILFGYFSPNDARQYAQARLEKTGDPLKISERMIAMRAVTMLLRDDSDGAAELLTTVLPERQSALANAWAKNEPAALDDLRFLGKRLEAADTAWWEVELAMHFRNQAEQLQIADDVIEEHHAHAWELMRVQIAASLFWILTAVIGIAFVPKFYRAVRSASSRSPKKYIEGIAASDVFIWFAISTWIADLMYRVAWEEVGWAYSIFPVWTAGLIDSAWRLLPVLIMGMWFFSRRRHFSAALGLRQRVPLGLIFAALTICYAWGWVAGLFSSYSDIHLTQYLEYEGFGWGWFTFSLISSCIVAPIVEEIVFRGFLFRGIANRFGVTIGILASAIIFSAIHYYPLYGFLSVAGLGVVNAWMFYATRSLVGPIVLHAVYNLVIKLNIWGVYLSDPLA